MNNRIETNYADVTLIHAHNILFKQAYNDGCSKIISLSQACIPLKTFDYVYSYLTKDDFSYFNISPNQRGVFPRCNYALKYYDKNYLQKTSNWFILNRKIAEIICFKTIKEINKIWKHISSPEEHYFISEIYKNNLNSEIITTPNLASGATTFTNWSDTDYPYQNHKWQAAGSVLKNYNEITLEEINYLIGQPCLFGRKFNSKCKIIQNKSNLQNVEKIHNLTHYLTKKICNLFLMIIFS